MLKGFFDKFKKKQENDAQQQAGKQETENQEQPSSAQPQAVEPADRPPKEPITEDVPLIQMDVPPISEAATPQAELPLTEEQEEAEATPAEKPAASDDITYDAGKAGEASIEEGATKETPIEETADEKISAEATPVEKPPMEAAPVDTATEAVPTDEKIEETAIKDAPVAQPPMEAATEEAPMEDASIGEAPVDAAPAEELPEESGKKGFFAKLRDGLTKTRSAIIDRVDDVLSSFKSIDDELFDELEEALIMADIGVDTSLYIIERLREEAKAQGVKEAHALRAVLKNIIQDILTEQDCSMNLSHQPSVIMVIGVNGVGKTTSIGKLAHRYKAEGKKVILAAGDTFRAAAIDQLQIWADRAGVDIVKHTEGSDPSAVVFDAVQAAKARGADMVICDTAGRLHNKKNLMEELKKTARVIERELGHPPNEVLLVLDASTGQNALVQAKEFAQVAGITGVILTKLDGTAKGGVVIALSREQGIGVKFVGVGEQMDDMQPFDPLQFAQALFPDTETDETK